MPSFPVATTGTPVSDNPPVFAVNQDGTVNASQNPARLGTVVALFVSSAGMLTPHPKDGQPGGFGPLLSMPVTAVLEYPFSDGTCCGRSPMQVRYAGSAPTLAAGMVQVNLLLPSLTSNGEAGILLNFSQPDPATGAVFSTSTTGAIWISN